MPVVHRDWTTYNFAALWISMAHCIPLYDYGWFVGVGAAFLIYLVLMRFRQGAKKEQ